jgi:hypothetical protein
MCPHLHPLGCEYAFSTSPNAGHLTGAVWPFPDSPPESQWVARVESLAGGKCMTGRTRDISLGGILVLSRDTLEPKSGVRIRFDLPRGRRVDVQGEVVRSTPGVRMG